MIMNFLRVTPLTAVTKNDRMGGEKDRGIELGDEMMRDGMMEMRSERDTRVTKVTRTNFSFNDQKTVFFRLQFSLCRKRKSGYGRRRSISLPRTDGCAS